MAQDINLNIVHEIIDEIVTKRKELGISHETLATSTGLNRSTISLIESKKRIPSILNVIRICKALGLSLGKLVLKYEKT
jgi:transcriptional regulator with XRE-family HTH domain